MKEHILELVKMVQSDLDEKKNPPRHVLVLLCKLLIEYLV